MEKLLTAQEVAARIALKVATIRRMILECRIATVRPSVRAVRIPESEVGRIIESGYTPLRANPAVITVGRVNSRKGPLSVRIPIESQQAGLHGQGKGKREFCADTHDLPNPPN